MSGTVFVVRMLHFSGTARVKDVPSDPDEYLALIGESYDHAVADAPWHEEDLQRKLMPVQLRYGANGAVMYMLHQDLRGYGERRDVPDADYLFSRFRGWRPDIAGDVLVCGHDGSADTDVPPWCMPLEPGSRCARGGRARGWRCDEDGQWNLSCSLHFGVFGDRGEYGDKIPDYRNEFCDTCNRAPVGGHFMYPGRADAWNRHLCMTCGPVGSVTDVEDHCRENGLCSHCWGHGWTYDNSTPCHECGGPGTITAQRSFRREELSDWRRRFPEADAIIRDLHSQGLGWREVGMPAGIARRVCEEGQPPDDEAAQLVVDHHACGWPDKTWEEEEDTGPEIVPADGHGEPWRLGSRVFCAAMVTDIRPVRRTKLRTVHFLSRDGRRLKWTSRNTTSAQYLQRFTPGAVGELDDSVNAIETDDDGPVAVISAGNWNPHPRGWHPTQSIFEPVQPDSSGSGS